MQPRDLMPWRIRALLSDIDASAKAERDAHTDFDRGPWAALLLGALSLVMMEYVGTPFALSRFVAALERPASNVLAATLIDVYASRWASLLELGFWTFFRVLGFAVIPMLVIRFVLNGRVRDYGLRTAGLRGHLGIYGLLFVLVLPLIALAATRDEFVRYYPFYRQASESWLDFGVWELMYALQFFALELFFRGFWLEACRRTMGSAAIAAMVVPYCMIHFTKPALEVLGAIVAGFVFGLLAMRTRSIWGGVLLHIAVALSMDVLALLRSTGLPTRLLPLSL
jgi:membrane protease YdiL (CAAX protease family)